MFRIPIQGCLNSINIGLNIINMPSTALDPALLSPPPGCSYPPQVSLDAEQEHSVRDVTKQFNVEAFKLPARSDKDTGKDADEQLALTEQEMMLLVRRPVIPRNSGG